MPALLPIAALVLSVALVAALVGLQRIFSALGVEFVAGFLTGIAFILVWYRLRNGRWP